MPDQICSAQAALTQTQAACLTGIIKGNKTFCHHAACVCMCVWGGCGGAPRNAGCGPLGAPHPPKSTPLTPNQLCDPHDTTTQSGPSWLNQRERRRVGVRGGAVDHWQSVRGNKCDAWRKVPQTNCLCVCLCVPPDVKSPLSEIPAPGYAASLSSHGLLRWTVTVLLSSRGTAGLSPSAGLSQHRAHGHNTFCLQGITNGRDRSNDSHSSAPPFVYYLNLLCNIYISILYSF